jgi:hypothetical protein
LARVPDEASPSDDERTGTKRESVSQKLVPYNRDLKAEKEEEEHEEEEEEEEEVKRNSRRESQHSNNLPYVNARVPPRQDRRSQRDGSVFRPDGSELLYEPSVGDDVPVDADLMREAGVVLMKGKREEG